MGLRFKWGNSNLSKIDESKGTYRYETNSGKTHEVNWMERNERHLTRYISVLNELSYIWLEHGIARTQRTFRSLLLLMRVSTKKCIQKEMRPVKRDFTTLGSLLLTCQEIWWKLIITSTLLREAKVTIKAKR